MWVAGLDENGLGPRLGPMVTSSALISTPTYSRSVWEKRARLFGFTDSKVAGGFGRMAALESSVLALVEHATGELPESIDELFQLVAAESVGRARARCPGECERQQCFGATAKLPIFGGDVRDGRVRLSKMLGRRGARVSHLRSEVHCASELNVLHVAGENKYALDLRSFTTHIDELALRTDAPMLAICGMVGGIRDYASRLAPWRDVAPLTASKGARVYDVQGVGEVRFEIKADARHAPVAIASMLGKYVRELWMYRINTYYQRHSTNDLPRASGYHDPVTTRFVDATALLRSRLPIADSCFIRIA